MGQRELTLIRVFTENAEFGVSPKSFGLLITIETAISLERTELQHCEWAHSTRGKIPLTLDPRLCFLLTRLWVSRENKNLGSRPNSRIADKIARIYAEVGGSDQFLD